MGVLPILPEGVAHPRTEAGTVVETGGRGTFVSYLSIYLLIIYLFMQYT